jgi:hypothetical protein
MLYDQVLLCDYYGENIMLVIISELNSVADPVAKHFEIFRSVFNSCRSGSKSGSY